MLKMLSSSLSGGLAKAKGMMWLGDGGAGTVPVQVDKKVAILSMESEEMLVEGSAA